ncbi:exodeoxyribonuclease I [Buchnera aphidicola (Macrosiphoniella sanborni)]|uniref:Exodeoxyribonuclease I n=1 Tax=Buchnera aphidicola (Macrosiphoniella sanborni) TaxID=1241865 RepID=A0A4D6Y419_9GAMM|nr:exodeoxyribonuclease I [Buchnera aphidicola]QCI24057.1 exodeoxyribonuclease I [Buchnera aphidicola (Macrosiphoniella sanborni)]
MLFKNNISTYLFYDYETFGKHTSLDKPAQFACIRTDMQFNIVDDPQYFYCIPPDDYLPDPNSVLITHITPQYTHKNGTNEYNFSKKVHDILIYPNTCIVGYNNIQFDDEITRNIFYRNFFDSYEWSWKNGNSRWDLLNILRACYVFRPNSIKWPKNKLGFTSFKLSDITKENNILHKNAHDAVSDVYATIEIAKIIQKKEPKLFNFFFNIRKKNELQKLINIKKFTPMIYISSYFTAMRHNASIVLPIMYLKKNNNVLIAIDLLKDFEILINLFKRISLNDNLSIKDFSNFGIVLLHLNRCPILAPMTVINKDDYNRLNFNLSLCKKNINLIKKNYFLIIHIENIFFKEPDINQSSNVDLKIYDSFFNLHDKKIIKSIRNTLPILLKNTNYSFYDMRLKTLLFRYRARNFFYTLDKNEKKIWLKYCMEIFNPIFFKKYNNQILILLKKNNNDFKKVILLKKLLNYAFQKNKNILINSINLN